MDVRTAFFMELLAEARRGAESAAKAAIDPLALKGIMDAETMKQFITTMKPIVHRPEFLAFMENTFLMAFMGLFTCVDGITATFDKKVKITDMEGQELSENLHEDFTRFLISNNHPWAK
jgi:hypothetical protein